MATSDIREELNTGLRARWDATSISKQLGFAAAAAAIGIFFIYLATEGAGVAVGLAGLVAVATGLYPIKDLIQDPVRADRTRWFMGGVLAIAVGCGLVWLALATAQAWVSAVGVLVVVLGLLPFSIYLGLGTKKRGKPTAIVGLVIVVAAVLALATDSIKVPSGLAIVLILIGITVYRTGLTGWLIDETAARRAAIIGAVGVVAGTILVCLGGQLINRWLFVLGALPGTLALHLLSVASTRAPAKVWKATSAAWQRWSRMGHIAAAFAVVATWVALWTWAQQPFWVSTAIAVGLFSIGASFVWRGESVLLVLLVGFVVVWVTIDRTVPAPAAIAEGAPRIVALGDSYMSGDGAPTFYEHTDVRGSQRNTCRRAPTAYPVLVAEALDYELQFLACSGAETTDLVTEGQMLTATDDATGRNPQLDDVGSVDGVEFVLISIGGNDASFKEVGQACLLPGSCDDIEGRWIGGAQSLSTVMVPTFTEIRDYFGSEIPVIVMAYPVMVEETACNTTMVTQGEHEFLLDFVTTINEQAQLSAAQAGVHFFDAGADAYVGDKLCTDGELSPAAVNFIALQPPEGGLLSRLSPGGWVHQSLHPNPAGHGRMAAALIAWLKAAPPGDNPDPMPDATLADVDTPLQPLAAVDDDELSDWKAKQWGRAAQQAWPIVVLLFLGGWGFAFTATHEGPFPRSKATTAQLINP